MNKKNDQLLGVIGCNSQCAIENQGGQRVDTHYTRCSSPKVSVLITGCKEARGGRQGGQKVEMEKG